MNQISHSPKHLHPARALFGLGAALCLLMAAGTSQAATILHLTPKVGGEGIQKALDSLPQGGEVDLTSGTFIVHHPIILRQDHQVLRGSGPATVLFLADKANCPVVVLGDPIAHPKGPTHDLTLAALQVDGNRKHQQRELWEALPDGEVVNNGVDVWDVDGATIQDVVCCHCRSGGMVTSAVTRNLTVHGFTAYDNQFDGLACYMTENCHFSKLFLHDNLAAGISLDLNFNHNLIDDAVLTANDLGVFMRQSRNNVFRGMTIQKSHHHGVFMAEAADWSKAWGWHICPGTECTGNTFNNIMVDNCGGKAFVVNDAACVSNFINGARFIDNGGGLVQAASNPVTVRDLVMESQHPQEALVAKPASTPQHPAAEHNSTKTL